MENLRNNSIIKTYLYFKNKYKAESLKNSRDVNKWGNFEEVIELPSKSGFTKPILAITSLNPQAGEITLYLLKKEPSLKAEIDAVTKIRVNSTFQMCDILWIEFTDRLGGFPALIYRADEEFVLKYVNEIIGKIQELFYSLGRT